MSQRPDPQTALGEVLYARRVELGISQEEVGLNAASSQAQISRIEAGENASFGLVARIAKALDWTMVELVQKVEERQADAAPSQPMTQARKNSQPRWHR